MTQAQFNFDLTAGELAKEQGMSQAEEASNSIDAARLIAVAVAKSRGSVTADDVQRELVRLGLDPLGASAGSLFRGSEWEFTGRWVKSERVSNHARVNRVWRLK